VLKQNFRAFGVIDTACTIFGFEKRSYLGEFEAEFKKAQGRESGAQVVLFDEKKSRVENLVTLSLSNIMTKCTQINKKEKKRYWFIDECIQAVKKISKRLVHVFYVEFKNKNLPLFIVSKST
jgi:hypothetical protein